ncbi:MAG: MBL fold metallo-hydrolase [Oscillospiraceae bacterium]|nr:MBL fold metallo-hydrolase [Oscillospiraceae bacterium]
MSRLCTLASSSRGNAMYVAGGSTALLIDCGISFRRVKQALESLSAETASLCGVIVTHEHTDHISGLTVLLKRLRLPLYASEPTLRYLCTHDLIPCDAEIIPLHETVCIGDVEVSPFNTPHDAAHSIGLRLSMPDGRRVGIATDLGHVTDTVRENLRGCDLVVLESNYDPGMLFCGSYPYYLKQRIKSEHGHLANADCADELVYLAANGSTRFVLGHLSEQNNIPQLAAQTARTAFAMRQMREGTDFTLTVAPARTPMEMAAF